jgi:hypothetical protein
MLIQYPRTAIIIGVASLIGLTPFSAAHAAAQKLSPAQCARLKSKSECESCMRKACGANGCGTKLPAGNKSVQWGTGCSSGI